MSDAFVPAVQSLWWVQTSMLPLADREEHRVVAVLAAPATTEGTVAVVLRSGPDGGFSRRVPVQCRLWTASSVTPIGSLDDTAFAALVDRFGV